MESASGADMGRASMLVKAVRWDFISDASQTRQDGALRRRAAAGQAQAAAEDSGP
jgi:hypothetical protein